MSYLVGLLNQDPNKVYKRDLGVMSQKLSLNSQFASNISTEKSNSYILRALGIIRELNYSSGVWNLSNITVTGLFPFL